MRDCVRESVALARRDYARALTKGNTTLMRPAKNNCISFQPFEFVAFLFTALTGARASLTRMPSSWNHGPASVRRQKLFNSPVSCFDSTRHVPRLPKPTREFDACSRSSSVHALCLSSHATLLGDWPLCYIHSVARLARVRLIHVAVPVGVPAVPEEDQRSSEARPCPRTLLESN